MNSISNESYCFDWLLLTFIDKFTRDILLLHYLMLSIYYHICHMSLSSSSTSNKEAIQKMNGNGMIENTTTTDAKADINEGF
jgi:hypothetical protein